MTQEIINGLTKQEKTTLSEPFPESILSNFNGFTYVPIEHVILRLNTAFGLNWDSRYVMHEFGKSVEKTSKNGNKYSVTPVYVAVELVVRSLTGSIITRVGFGGNKEGFGNGDGDGFKSAYSDALKKAAQSLGVGLDIAIDARARKKNKSYGGSRGGSGPVSRPSFNNSPTTAVSTAAVEPSGTIKRPTF